MFTEALPARLQYLILFKNTPDFVVRQRFKTASIRHLIWLWHMSKLLLCQPDPLTYRSKYTEIHFEPIANHEQNESDYDKPGENWRFQTEEYPLGFQQIQHGEF